MRKPTNRLVKGGFTLIEILVVLVIMGFLVAMVAPKLANITDGAIDTTCESCALLNQSECGIENGDTGMCLWHAEHTVCGANMLPPP